MSSLTVADAIAAGDHVRLARGTARRRGEIERTPEFARIIAEHLSTQDPTSPMPPHGNWTDSLLRYEPRGAGASWADDDRRAVAPLIDELISDVVVDARPAARAAAERALRTFAPLRGVGNDVRSQLRWAIREAARDAISDASYDFAADLLDELAAAHPSLPQDAIRAVLALNPIYILGPFGPELADQIRTVMVWRVEVLEALLAVGVDVSHRHAHEAACIPEHWVTELAFFSGPRAMDIAADIQAETLRLIGEVPPPRHGDVSDLYRFAQIVSHRAGIHAVRPESVALRTGDGPSPTPEDDAYIRDALRANLEGFEVERHQNTNPSETVHVMSVTK